MLAAVDALEGGADVYMYPFSGSDLLPALAVHDRGIFNTGRRLLRWPENHGCNIEAPLLLWLCEANPIRALATTLGVELAVLEFLRKQPREYKGVWDRLNARFVVDHVERDERSTAKLAAETFVAKVLLMGRGGVSACMVAISFAQAEQLIARMHGLHARIAGCALIRCSGFHGSEQDSGSVARLLCRDGRAPEFFICDRPARSKVLATTHGAYREGANGEIVDWGYGGVKLIKRVL